MSDPLTTAFRLVEALKSPAAYPHPVDAVELVETHISWVLLAGEYAYKIKKPVNFGFADFSTLERRHRFCLEEVRLNRRLSPELYLGVVPVTRSADGAMIDGQGETVEFAVQMRRFSQESLLGRVLDRGELAAEHIDQLAETIARFHLEIAVATPDVPFGSPSRVWQPVEENFEFISSDGADSLVGRIESWSRSECDARSSDFADRKASGFVRECHGDLHLGNMLLWDDRVTVFDGIEFNDDLRWIDVISEIAFVVMDLEDRGCADLARRFLNAYLERTGDYEGVAVLPFYLTYRAMVRAKVASIRAKQADVTAGERDQADAQCRTYLDLAEHYIQRRQPALLITHGLSGSGKTTVTQSLLEAIGAVRVRSDVERKRLHGLEPIDRPLADSLYRPESTERAYARLATCSETILRAGLPAIIDAAFLSTPRREDFRRLAESFGAPFVILDVRASESALCERLERRRRGGRDASDADLDVLAKQITSRDPLTDEELACTVEIPTDRSHAVADAIRAVQDLLAGG